MTNITYEGDTVLLNGEPIGVVTSEVRYDDHRNLHEERWHGMTPDGDRVGRLKGEPSRDAVARKLRARATYAERVSA